MVFDWCTCVGMWTYFKFIIDILCSLYRHAAMGWLVDGYGFNFGSLVSPLTLQPFCYCEFLFLLSFSWVNIMFYSISCAFVCARCKLRSRIVDSHSSRLSIYLSRLNYPDNREREQQQHHRKIDSGWRYSIQFYLLGAFVTLWLVCIFSSCLHSILCVCIFLTIPSMHLFRTADIIMIRENKIAKSTN